MLLSRRECFRDADGFGQCYSDEDGFWYTDKGIIIKWIVLVAFFLVFFGWFVGGYIHAKQRLRKGLRLLAYHRFLVSHSERRRYGQGPPLPQNHFTFYTHNAYQQPHAAYTQRQDGAWAEPPPLYHPQQQDSPPQYFPPPQGASKLAPDQGGVGGAGAGSNGPAGVELPMYGGPGPQGGQQSGVVGGTAGGHVEQGGSGAQGLPPRPETARTRLMGVVGRFRR